MAIVKFGSINVAVLGRDELPRTVFYPEATLDGALWMRFVYLSGWKDDTYVNKVSRH